MFWRGANGDTEYLPDELLWSAIVQLRGEDLNELELVNRHCARFITNDLLWRELVCRRWNVPGKQSARMRNSKTSWRSIYNNWRSVKRIPSSRYSGQRSAVFAYASIPNVAGMWVCVKPTEDCKVSRNNKMALRITIQNLNARSIQVDLSSLNVKFKDDAFRFKLPNCVNVDSHTLSVKLLYYHQLYGSNAQFYGIGKGENEIRKCLSLKV
uniref:F-box domain-containing protein n=1 Tax=Timspurckia oligopyrenoides TaxID=708627 RepID=A0A7S0ZCP3_9RHOD